MTLDEEDIRRKIFGSITIYAGIKCRGWTLLLEPASLKGAKRILKKVKNNERVYEVYGAWWQPPFHSKDRKLIPLTPFKPRY